MTNRAEDAPTRVINMWSGPRNVSTAFMYSWRQRPDTQVFDEPFYARYLTQFDPGHPGMDDVLASMDTELDTIMASIVAPGPRPVRFIKNISHHYDALDVTVLDAFTNAMLFRHPAGVVASLTATLGEGFSIDITGFRQLGEILDHELASGDAPIVVHSADLLDDPPAMLRALCDRLEVPYTDAMLAWPAGPKPEDGVWAEHWYHNAHRSTGFARPTDRPVEGLTTWQRAMVDECLVHYERLLDVAIRPSR